MIPLCSCDTPGKKPGTSTKVTIGILKQSQNLTNLPPFLPESISRHPAKTKGWFATNPTVHTSILPKPVIIFCTKSG